MNRKKQVPFLTGRIEIWAAAVIHALGTINFLFDKSNQPYASVTDINGYFGTKQSTISQKSKKIRDMFNMTYFDSDFSIESVNRESPFNNLSLVNGFIVPQDMVKEKTVEIDESDFQTAQILGIKGLARNKKYEEGYLFELFQVNVLSLMKFYGYLLNHLTFPFTALYEEEIGPLEIAEFEVDCIGLDQEIEVDETFGILVECILESKKVILPLASIYLDKKHHNYEWIDLYHDWFWLYR